MATPIAETLRDGAVVARALNEGITDGATMAAQMEALIVVCLRGDEAAARLDALEAALRGLCDAVSLMADGNTKNAIWAPAILKAHTEARAALKGET